LDTRPLLFDVAALLSPSSALGGVAEAFVVHEISRQVSSNVLVVDSAALNPSGLAAWLDPARSVGDSTATDITTSSPVDPSLLPRLTGNLLLDQMSLLPSSEVASYVASHGSAVHRLLVSPPRATAVASWWSAKTPAEQQALAAKAPGIVGNLDGVPFAARDRANRVLLARSIATLKASIDSGAGRAKLVERRHHLDILNQVARTLASAAGQPRRQLVTLDTSGEVRAAVAVGDLASADYVSYLVPGMFFTVQGQMYDWTVIAQDLQTQQAHWLKTLSTADPSLAGKTAATVAWIGYKTPGVLDIASLDRAKSGANYLGHAVQGIQAVRSGAEPYVTLVTHSYGSTTAMMELANGGMTVDALAIIGSPGAAAQSASALAVRNDNVFVGEAAWDPIVNTAFYGSDPGSSTFGARKMDVAGGTDAITHKTLAAAVGHLGYFDTGTAAMRNIALIGLDQGDLVTTGSLADSGRTLADAK
jgi:hypothetical protein